MTALTSRAGPSHSIPCINHRCLRRRSLRTYELLDPANPSHVQAYDVGQVKEIVQMDKRLREQGVVSPVPAGFWDFTTLFNHYAVGPERFATYTVSQGRVDIQKNGSPIVWEHFMIDDWLVGWDRDPAAQQASGSSLSSSTTSMYQEALPSFELVEYVLDPKMRALSARMRVAIQTTDELTKFWIKRGAIEHQYASRLANLAETMIGESDSKELRRAIDAVRVETAQQAMRRHDLAKRIVVDLEKRSLDMQIKQRAYWQEYYEPSARKLHDDQVRASRRRSVATEWKQEYKKLRYSLDSRRLQSMMPDPHFARGSHGGAPDFDTISEASVESPKAPHGLAKSWDELCSSSWQQEKDRCHSMEDSLSVFIDTLSMALETDHGSINTIHQWKDLFVPKDFIEEFAQTFGPRRTPDTVIDVRARAPSSSSRGPLPSRPTSRPTVAFDIEAPSTPPSSRGSSETQRPREVLPSRAPESTSRSSTPRERVRHSMGSFAVGTTFGPRSLTRSNSQRQAALLPLSPEPQSPPSHRPTLSKIANVFQRSNTATSRSSRDGYVQ